MSSEGNLTLSGMVNGLQKIIDGWLSLDLWAHLYLVGPLSVSETTTLAQVVAQEANFLGYAPQRLTTWSAPVILALQGGLIHYAMTQAPAVFNVTDPAGSGNLAGWFLTDATFTKLFQVSNFFPINPFSVPNGETVNLTVQWLHLSYWPYGLPALP